MLRAVRHSVVFLGAGGGTRTPDTRIMIPRRQRGRVHSSPRIGVGSRFPGRAVPSGSGRFRLRPLPLCYHPDHGPTGSGRCRSLTTGASTGRSAGPGAGRAGPARRSTPSSFVGSATTLRSSRRSPPPRSPARVRAVTSLDPPSTPAPASSASSRPSRSADRCLVADRLQVPSPAAEGLDLIAEAVFQPVVTRKDRPTLASCRLAPRAAGRIPTKRKSAPAAVLER